jgi:hypothetical protein
MAQVVAAGVGVRRDGEVVAARVGVGRDGELEDTGVGVGGAAADHATSMGRCTSVTRMWCT